MSSRDRPADRVRVSQIIQSLDEEVSGEWLTEKSDTACLHGPPFDLLIVAPGDENHGECDAAICKLMHKFNTAAVAQLSIDNEANRLSGDHRLKEFAGREIEFYIKSIRWQ